MNRTWTTLSLTTLALGLVVATTYATSSFMARPTAVGVVDMETLFNALSEKQAFDADLRDRRAGLEQARGQREAAINTLQFDLDALKAGTDAFNRKQAELEKSVLEFQVWAQFEQRKIQREAGIKTEQLYRRIVEAIGRVAQEGGYDIVLFKEGELDLEYENLQQLAQMIQMRKVLYANSEVNITNQVVRRMNNEFENLRR